MIGVILSVGLLSLPAAPARDLKSLYERAAFTVGDARIEAFVADDDQRRAQGLMNVEHLDVNEGMLFVFDEPQRLRFWMKNTLIPLAIGFFDRRCRLIETLEMQVAASVLTADVPTYQSRAEAVFALEMNRGWFGRHGVKAGAVLRARGAPKSATLRDALSICK